MVRRIAFDRSKRSPSSRILPTIVGVLVATLLAGCAGSGPSSATNGSAPLSTASSPPSTAHSGMPTGAVTAERLAPHGLIVLDCTGEQMRLETIDPASGQVTGSEVVPKQFDDPVFPAPEYDLTATCGPVPDPTWHTREFFDPSFTKLVVTSTDQPDGSKHVGWLDLTTGKITDVTARDIGSAFTSQTPTDQYPKFDEITGLFWWTRSFTSGQASQVLSIDPRTMQETDHTPSSGSGFDGADGGQLLRGNGVPDPTGTRAAVASQGPGLPPHGEGVEVFDLSQPRLSDDQVTGQLHVVPGMPAFCEVQSWLDATHVILSAGSPTWDYGSCPSSEVDVGESRPSLVPLLPPNDHANRDFTPSPDGKTFAFASTGNGKNGIYLWGGSATAEPRDLYDVSENASQFPLRLLAWR